MQHQATLHGAICGQLWGEGKGAVPVTAVLSRCLPLRQSVEAFIKRHGGDFQPGSVKLASGSFIRIVMRRQKRNGSEIKLTRYVDVDALPSLAGLINADVFASDFE